MMTNLFSIFDPASSILSINWTVLVIFIILIPNSIWSMKNTSYLIMQNLMNILWKEIKFTMKWSKKGSELVILNIFSMILILNIMALYPQVFSTTSNLMITLPLSLSMWMSIMMFGWLKNFNHMMAHLVPQGTPLILMSFMVLIETTSTLIRPITLCVRLTANLIAGHLLMTLLNNSLMTSPTYLFIPSMSVSLILTMLETAVAFIQAYVFMTLITLYIMEIK